MNASQRLLCSGQERGRLVGKTKRGKGPKLVVLVDDQGTPLELHVDSASPSEVQLLAQTIETVRVARPHQRGRPRQWPERLIADRGDDTTPFGRPCNTGASSRPSRRGPTTPWRPIKMTGSCAGIAAAGSSNGRSVGFRPSAASPHGGTGLPRCTPRWLIWLVPSWSRRG